jgi:hypothetical protein
MPRGAVQKLQGLTEVCKSIDMVCRGNFTARAPHRLLINSDRESNGFRRSFRQVLRHAIRQIYTSLYGAGDGAQSVKAAGLLEGALGRLMVVVENYPDLKANKNFLALQDELAGTENRISTERRHYNEAVASYNVKSRVLGKT